MELIPVPPREDNSWIILKLIVSRRLSRLLFLIHLQMGTRYQKNKKVSESHWQVKREGAVVDAPSCHSLLARFGCERLAGLLNN